jgi:hypothetical protein
MKPLETTQKSYFIKDKYKLSQYFISYLGNKKWKKLYNFPHNRNSRLYQQVLDNAIIEWYDKMIENRCRLLQKTPHAYMYCNLINQ